MHRAQPLFRSDSARQAWAAFVREMVPLEREAEQLKKEGGDLADISEKIDALQILYNAKKAEESGVEDAVLAKELLESGQTEFEYMLGDAASGVRRKAHAAHKYQQHRVLITMYTGFA